MNRKYRKTVIAGNWKMNMLASEIKPFMEELRAAMPAPRACDVVLCTPAVMIPTMVKKDRNLWLIIELIANFQFCIRSPFPACYLRRSLHHE